MTVIDDVDRRELKYRSMKFVEFIEYIARTADFKFKEESCDLFEKIEKLLDLILPSYGLKRVRE